MIIQALTEYYDRKTADSQSSIAPLGWEWKELPFLIVIDEQGHFVRIEDTREDINGKRKKGKTYLVPKAVKRTRGAIANWLYDSVDYVTGLPCEGKERDIDKKNALFLEHLHQLNDCLIIRPVIEFINNREQVLRIKEDEAWKELHDTSPFVSFQLVNDDMPIFDNKEVRDRYNLLNNNNSEQSEKHFCLISGRKNVISRIHPPIKGVRDVNTTGGSIVCFNNDAESSFGKSQGNNAPISEDVAFKYTTALNLLLSGESKQKMQIGDATTVFWSSKDSSLENAFRDFFDDRNIDNPDGHVETVERLLSSVQTGTYTQDNEVTKFYVLGLSPNSARISIRFWQVGTIAEMERRFADWFSELMISHGPNQKDHLSLFSLLRSIAPQNDSKNISPNLSGEIMRSILSGGHYPETLLLAAHVRIRANRDVSYPLAKLIKAFLIRNRRRQITMSLDKSCDSIGYRLGRLFAALERIQTDANPGINATIRDRYYASASATPSAVFGVLLRLKNYHLAKLSKTGFYETLLGEIIENIKSFPAHLSMEEQGMFAIGYYHQRQNFYERKVVDSDTQPTKSEE